LDESTKVKTASEDSKNVKKQFKSVEKIIKDIEKNVKNTNSAKKIEKNVKNIKRYEHPKQLETKEQIFEPQPFKTESNKEKPNLHEMLSATNEISHSIINKSNTQSMTTLINKTESDTLFDKVLHNIKKKNTSIII
jgi:hypothetical protein